MPVNIITGQYYSSSLHCCFFSIIWIIKHMWRTAWSGLFSWISALKLSNMRIIAVSEIISWFHAPCESVLLYKVQTEFRQSCIICAEMRDEGIVFFSLKIKQKQKTNEKKRGKNCRHALSYHTLSFELEHNAKLWFSSKWGRLWIQNNTGESRTSPTRSSIILHNKRH